MLVLEALVARAPRASAVDTPPAPRFVDALHHLVIELGDYVERTEVLAHLSRTARASDHTRHTWVACAPCERKLRQRAAEFLGDGHQTTNLLAAPFLGDHPLHPFVARKLGAAVVGHAV